MSLAMVFVCECGEGQLREMASMVRDAGVWLETRRIRKDDGNALLEWSRAKGIEPFRVWMRRRPTEEETDEWRGAVIAFCGKR